MEKLLFSFSRTVNGPRDGHPGGRSSGATDDTNEARDAQDKLHQRSDALKKGDHLRGEAMRPSPPVR